MSRSWMRARSQAMVEVAVAAPLLILLVLGAVGVGRLVHARMALDAVTREAARATVLSPMPSVRSDGDSEWRTARDNGRSQGEAVARGFGLSDVQLEFDVQPSFAPGSWVSAEAQVDIEAVHLPFMRRFFGNGARDPTVTLHSQHWERIDRYRSRLP